MRGVSLSGGGMKVTIEVVERGPTRSDDPTTGKVRPVSARRNAAAVAREGVGPSDRAGASSIFVRTDLADGHALACVVQE